jgi:hypothetical protein
VLAASATRNPVPFLDPTRECLLPIKEASPPPAPGVAAEEQRARSASRRCYRNARGAALRWCLNPPAAAAQIRPGESWAAGLAHAGDCRFRRGSSTVILRCVVVPRPVVGGAYGEATLVVGAGGDITGERFVGRSGKDGPVTARDRLEELVHLLTGA